MKTILFSLACVALFGVFLTVRGVIYLWRHGDKQTAVFATALFLLLPLGIWLLANTPMEKMNPWVVMPALLLLLVWISIGYLLDGYRRKDMEGPKSGAKNSRPSHTGKGFVVRDGVCCLFGIGLWLYGFCIGFPNKTVDTMALCICLFLLTISFASFWRYLQYTSLRRGRTDNRTTKRR